jgi:hypothetical protein
MAPPAARRSYASVNLVEMYRGKSPVNAAWR